MAAEPHTREGFIRPSVLIRRTASLVRINRGTLKVLWVWSSAKNVPRGLIGKYPNGYLKVVGRVAEGQTAFSTGGDTLTCLTIL